MNFRPITESLAVHIATVSGFPCEPMEGPTTDLLETFGDTLPYTLLEPLDGVTWNETFGGGWDEAQIPYQLIAYGLTKQQASALADETRSALLDHDVNVTGAVVMHVSPGDGPATPEQVGNDLAEVRERFTLHVHAG